MSASSTAGPTDESAFQPTQILFVEDPEMTRDPYRDGDDPQGVEPSTEELLRGRIVDRCDALTDWDALDGLAAADPLLWQRLGRDLRLDCELRQTLAPTLRRAERVDLTAPAGAPRPRATRVGVVALGRWAGWAAAVVVGLLWWRDRPSAVPDQLPVPVASSPFDWGAQGGRVAGAPDGEPPAAMEASHRALPGMLVRAAPAEDGGGLRVLYVHRELREAVVDQAFAMAAGADAASAVPVERYETPTDF